MVDVMAFCGHCGSPSSAAGDRYCRKCGYAFDLPDAIGSTPPPPWDGPAPPSSQPGPYAFYRPRTTNGLAVASLVLGILWLYWIGSILALVFGYIARAEIRRSHGAEQGRGLALAGIILGWIGIGVAVAALVFGIVAVAADNSRATSSAHPISNFAAQQDSTAKADLRNVLTAEKTHYVDTEQYSTDAATMLQIEPDLLWNRVGGPQVSVGDVTPGDRGVVCIQEESRSGTMYAIADVAAGPSAGTYYAKASCTTSIPVVTAWPGW